MSLRPRFARAMLAGTKTVELRRTKVSEPVGTTIIIYASAPVMSVVGLATLAATDTDLPDDLWRRHGPNLGITGDEFNEYLLGTATATCISVAAPEELPMPYPLAWLRDHGAFRPPQSYRYLTHRDPQPLHALVGSSR